MIPDSQHKIATKYGARWVKKWMLLLLVWVKQKHLARKYLYTMGNINKDKIMYSIRQERHFNTA